jgi:hypothetical protein
VSTVLETLKRDGRVAWTPNLLRGNRAFDDAEVSRVQRLLAVARHG